MGSMDKEEKGTQSPTGTEVALDVDVGESQNYSPKKSWVSKVLSWGVELRGITPVPPEERTDRRFINVFFVWWTMSINLLP